MSMVSRVAGGYATNLAQHHDELREVFALIHAIQDDRPWYLATPYSNYPEGHDAAWKDACLVAGALLNAGVQVFSPIVHWHPIAKMQRLPTDAVFWKSANDRSQDACAGVIVCELPGWKDSAGMKAEVQRAHAHEQPVIHLPCPKFLFAR